MCRGDRHHGPHRLNGLHRPVSPGAERFGKHQFARLALGAHDARVDAAARKGGRVELHRQGIRRAVGLPLGKERIAGVVPAKAQPGADGAHTTDGILDEAPPCVPPEGVQAGVRGGVSAEIRGQGDARLLLELLPARRAEAPQFVDIRDVEPEAVDRVLARQIRHHADDQIAVRAVHAQLVVVELDDRAAVGAHLVPLGVRRGHHVVQSDVVVGDDLHPALVERPDEVGE